MPLALEYERVAVDVLSDECLAEAEVGNADGAPGEELGNGNQVLEPVEDVAGAGRDGHVCKEGDGGGDEDTPDWDTGLGALEKEARSLTDLGKCEQVTGAGEEESVGGRRCRGQDDGVDDRWEGWDTGTLDGNNPRRSSGTDTTVEKSSLVGRDKDTNGEGTEDVEEQDTPEDTANGLWNVLARVLSLAGSDGNHLNTTVGESGVDEGREKTSEAADIANSDVLLHGTWVLPVAKAKSVVGWSTAEVNDQGKEKQTDNGEDLDRSEDELGFSVDGYGKDVQSKNDDNDDGDPSSLVDGVVPETNNNSSGGDFSAKSNGRVVPVVPSNSKTESRVDVAGAVLWDSTREREPCTHLTKTLHHGEDGTTGEGVTKEDRQGTGVGESLADTEEKTGTNGTTEGDELNVTGLETTLHVAKLLGGSNVAVDISSLADGNVMVACLLIIWGGRHLDTVLLVLGRHDAEGSLKTLEPRREGKSDERE